MQVSLNTGGKQNLNSLTANTDKNSINKANLTSDPSTKVDKKLKRLQNKVETYNFNDGPHSIYDDTKPISTEARENYMLQIKKYTDQGFTSTEAKSIVDGRKTVEQVITDRFKAMGLTEQDAKDYLKGILSQDRLTKKIKEAQIKQLTDRGIPADLAKKYVNGIITQEQFQQELQRIADKQFDDLKKSIAEQVKQYGLDEKDAERLARDVYSGMDIRTAFENLTEEIATEVDGTRRTRMLEYQSVAELEIDGCYNLDDLSKYIIQQKQELSEYIESTGRTEEDIKNNALAHLILKMVDGTNLDTAYDFTIVGYYYTDSYGNKRFLTFEDYENYWGKGLLDEKYIEEAHMHDFITPEEIEEIRKRLKVKEEKDTFYLFNGKTYTYYVFDRKDQAQVDWYYEVMNEREKYNNISLSENNNEIKSRIDKLKELELCQQYITENVTYHRNNDKYTHKDDFTIKCEIKQSTIEYAQEFIKKADNNAKSGTQANITFANDDQNVSFLIYVLNNNIEVLSNSKIKVNGIEYKVSSSNNTLANFLFEWRHLITDEEIKIMTYIYNTQGGYATLKYLEEIASQKDKERVKEKAETDIEWARENYALAKACSVILRPAEGLYAIAQSIDASLSGDKLYRTNTYGTGETFRSETTKMTGEIIGDLVWYMSTSEFAKNGFSFLNETFGTDIDYNEFANEASKNINKMASFVDGVTMSIVDSTLLIGTGSALSITTKFGTFAITAAIMGTSSYGSILNDALSRDVPQGRAMLLALTGSIIETAMESYSLGHLMNLEEKLTDGTKSIIKKLVNENTSPKTYKFFVTTAYTISQSIAEGEEELCTSILQEIADNLISGDKSSRNIQIKNYLDQNYTLEEAKNMVNKEFIGELWQSFLGGFISGSIFGHMKGKNIATEVVDNIAEKIMDEYDISRPDAYIAGLEYVEYITKLQEEMNKQLTPEEKTEYMSKFMSEQQVEQKITEQQTDDLLAQEIERVERISVIAQTVKDMNNAQIKEYLSNLSEEVQNDIKSSIVELKYKQGMEKADTDYVDFFKNFREHAEQHTEAVKEYALAKAREAGLTGEQLAQVEFAAKYHDLGMNGGVFEGNDGNYYNIDSLVPTGEPHLVTKDGKSVLLQDYRLDTGTEVIYSAAAEDSISLVKANLARKNHPLNSAVQILCSDLSPVGVNNGIVALLAMSHSKSTSGINNFTNEEQWNKAIDIMVKAVASVDSTVDVDAISKELKELIKPGTDSFEMLQKQALTIRDGDAMAPPILDLNGNQLMQTGKSSRVSVNYVLLDDSMVPFTTSATEEAEMIVDSIVDETGKVLSQINNAFSKKTHAGELNSSYTSTFDGKHYEATLTVNDGRVSPASTLDAIYERIGEIATYTNTDRVTKIFIKGVTADSNLAQWYRDEIVRRNESIIQELKTKKKLTPEYKEYYSRNFEIEFEDHSAIARNEMAELAKQVIDMTSAERRSYLKGLDVEVRNQLKQILVTYSYKLGMEKAATVYVDFFENFREHAEAHTNAVMMYARKKAKEAGITGAALEQVIYASKYHDLGMNGGVFKGIDGKYYDIDSLIPSENTHIELNDKGKEILIQGYRLESGTEDIYFAPAEDSLSLVRANLARKNHPLNSAIQILCNDLSPDGVNNAIVALLAMSHSKSTSGINNFKNQNQWFESIETMLAAAYSVDSSIDVEGIRKELKSIVGNRKSFEMLQKQALTVRDGDAMADLVLSRDHQVMQTGNIISLIQFKLESDNEIPETNNAKEEAKLIRDAILDSNMKVIKEIENTFSKKTHAGELNSSYSSTFDGTTYSATLTVNNGKVSPASTLDAIYERLGEIATYTNTERTVKIVIKEVNEDSPLAQWFRDEIQRRNTEVAQEIRTKGYSKSSIDFYKKGFDITFIKPDSNNKMTPPSAPTADNNQQTSQRFVSYVEGDAKTVEQRVADLQTHNSFMTNSSVTNLYNFFENVGSMYDCTYGVDQGIIEKMCRYYIYDTQLVTKANVSISSNNQYDYRQAKKICNYCMENGLPLPITKNCKIGSKEYGRLKDKLKSLGYSAADASVILSSINDFGACSYAAVLNNILYKFQGNESYFESVFGYPMYTVINGVRTFNSAELLLDLFLFANDGNNTGYLFFNNRLNVNTLSNTVDIFGRRIIDDNYQKYMMYSANLQDGLLTSFLQSKDPKLTCVGGTIYDNMNAEAIKMKDFKENIVSQVENSINNGKAITLTCFYKQTGRFKHTGVINFLSADKKAYPSISTKTWHEGTGHAVAVTGITGDSFIVSSWGQKYFIPFKDLANKGSFGIIETDILYAR